MQCACWHNKYLANSKLHFATLQYPKTFSFNTIKYFIVFRMFVKWNCFIRIDIININYNLILK